MLKVPVHFFQPLSSRPLSPSESYTRKVLATSILKVWSLSNSSKQSLPFRTQEELDGYLDNNLNFGSCPKNQISWQHCITLPQLLYTMTLAVQSDIQQHQRLSWAHIRFYTTCQNHPAIHVSSFCACVC